MFSNLREKGNAYFLSGAHAYETVIAADPDWQMFLRLTKNYGLRVVSCGIYFLETNISCMSIPISVILVLSRALRKY